METPEKFLDYDITPVARSIEGGSTKIAGESEVFATSEDGINFRTVGWVRGKVNPFALISVY